MKTSKTLNRSAAILAAGLAAATMGTANANPFAISDLQGGYGQVAAHHGEAKCGGNKAAESKCGGNKAAEMKCGEGKCGSSSKAAEAKCGEAKCGGSK